MQQLCHLVTHLLLGKNNCALFFLEHATSLLSAPPHSSPRPPPLPHLERVLRPVRPQGIHQFGVLRAQRPQLNLHLGPPFFARGPLLRLPLAQPLRRPRRDLWGHWLGAGEPACAGQKREGRECVDAC